MNNILFREEGAAVKDNNNSFDITQFEAELRAINTKSIFFDKLVSLYNTCTTYNLNDDYRKIIFDAFLRNDHLTVKDLADYYIHYSNYFSIELKTYVIQNNLIDEFIREIDGTVIRDNYGYSQMWVYNKWYFYEDLPGDYQLGVVI